MCINLFLNIRFFKKLISIYNKKVTTRTWTIGILEQKWKSPTWNWVHYILLLQLWTYTVWWRSTVLISDAYLKFDLRDTLWSEDFYLTVTISLGDLLNPRLQTIWVQRIQLRIKFSTLSLSFSSILSQTLFVPISIEEDPWHCNCTLGYPFIWIS